MSEEPHVKVTLRDIYDEIRALRTDVEGRVRKLESQTAAQWVVVSIIVAGLGAAVGKALVGG